MKLPSVAKDEVKWRCKQTLKTNYTEISAQQVYCIEEYQVKYEVRSMVKYIINHLYLTTVVISDEIQNLSMWEKRYFDWVAKMCKYIAAVTQVELIISPKFWNLC